MACKGNNFIRMKVNLQISKMFASIISDIPGTSCKERKNELSIQKNRLISMDAFCDAMYKYALECIPNEEESFFSRFIRNTSSTAENIKRINETKKIIKLQNNILDKYFRIHGEFNIKDKINELNREVNNLIEDGNIEYLDRVLENFEGRMRSSFLTDMKKLSQLLSDRERGKQ